ncbi:hypothetical protein DSCA_23020 [Desulfosarcina alkanivorans]|uniref:PEP-CTERM protein-sorting domain-containing protein n=1 Tax=Desulfosarcina alkanivorans TaxID=571177 RepID=A0A5K7YFQ9_9BACT|nr:VPLPA-CTERM sorting domain-containing protein [Desulfosarcina alkanivorans]BBO68372.1 hypothetical protein DSCA_23020 [Desulfosarcina alkanivorans]
MNRSRLFVLFTMLVLGLLLGSSSALAHSVTIDDAFEMGLGDTGTIGHKDEPDWKGTLTLTVTNTGDDPWGDFHFYLQQDGPVVFGTTDTIFPTIMAGVSGYTYDISDYALDFYFYSDPVENGQSATFLLYTDNTEEKLGLFSISMEASPVPLPAAAWLLGSGLVGMIAMRRK